MLLYWGISHQILQQKRPFFPPRRGQNNYFRHFLRSYRSACTIAPLHHCRNEAIKNHTLVCYLCSFSLYGPINKNDCMHRTCNLVKFACRLLLCWKKMFEGAHRIEAGLRCHFSIYLMTCSSLHLLTVAPLHKSAWPGGMRGAIESAALAVWQALAC